MTQALFTVLSPIALALSGPSGGDGATRVTIDEESIRFLCEGGTTIIARFYALDGLPFAKVTFPNPRSGQNVSQLLVLTQSGSGVRYATDLITLHIKGDQASFEVGEHALSGAITRKTCELRD